MHVSSGRSSFFWLSFALFACLILTPLADGNTPTTNIRGPLQSRFCFVGWKQWRLAGTRLHQLEPAAAIRGPHHGDVDSDAIEPDDVLHYRLPIHVPFVAHFLW